MPADLVLVPGAAGFRALNGIIIRTFLNVLEFKNMSSIYFYCDFIYSDLRASMLKRSDSLGGPENCPVLGPQEVVLVACSA